MSSGCSALPLLLAYALLRLQCNSSLRRLVFTAKTVLSRSLAYSRPEKIFLAMHNNTTIQHYITADWFGGGDVGKTALTQPHLCLFARTCSTAGAALTAGSHGTPGRTAHQSGAQQERQHASWTQQRLQAIDKQGQTASHVSLHGCSCCVMRWKVKRGLAAACVSLSGKSVCMIQLNLALYTMSPHTDCNAKKTAW